LKSHINASFRKRFGSLPGEVQEQARAAYRLFRDNPRHPGLNFKRIHETERYVSARVGRSYRAVGVMSASDEVVWFWIGPHEEYEKIIYTL
jgi:hypothetical protein